MKINATRAPAPQPPFIPVTVTVTLQSQAEVDALFHVGNNSSAISQEATSRPYYSLPSCPDQGVIESVLAAFYRALKPYRTEC